MSWFTHDTVGHLSQIHTAKVVTPALNSSQQPHGMGCLQPLFRMIKFKIADHSFQ